MKWCSNRQKLKNQMPPPRPPRLVRLPLSKGSPHQNALPHKWPPQSVRHLWLKMKSPPSLVKYLVGFVVPVTKLLPMRAILSKKLKIRKRSKKKPKILVKNAIVKMGVGTIVVKVEETVTEAKEIQSAQIAPAAMIARHPHEIKMLVGT